MPCVNRSPWQIVAALSLVLAACSGASTSPSDNGPPGSEQPSASAILDHELTDVRSGERFTLRQLAADRPVLVETMAVRCTTCRSQQREVVRAHELADFHSVGINVDPSERAGELAAYADQEGFDWRFAMADAALVQLLTDAYGFAVLNPPSTPTFVISTDGRIRALEFGRVRSADELVAEMGVRSD